MPTKEKAPAKRRGPFHIECRRRPTLPHPDECSTIGAGGLSFRVRDGTGRSPSANTTDNTIHLSPHKPGSRTHHPPHHPDNSGGVLRVTQWMRAQRHTVDASNKNACGQVLGLLVPVNSTPHDASISGLSTPSSPGGLNPTRWGGRPHLGTSFPLRCLQRLSLPNIANQPCPWRDNWHTRGPSVPVLSY